MLAIEGLIFKTNSAIDWVSNPSEATPVTDIQAVLRLARVEHDTYFDRIRMNPVCLKVIAKTTHFLNQSKVFSWPPKPCSQLEMSVELMEKMLGGSYKIELKDTFPQNQILFLDTRNGNKAVLTFSGE
jgi:hypothetical protein